MILREFKLVHVSLLRNQLNIFNLISYIEETCEFDNHACMLGWVGHFVQGVFCMHTNI